MKWNRYITLFMVLAGPFLKAQEGQFSQYFASTALLNPGFAGITPDLSFNTNYKRGGNPDSDSFVELIQATFIFPFMKVTSKEYQIGGAGLTFTSEKRGVRGTFTVQQVLLSGAYTIKLAELHNQYLTFGVQGGVVQNRLTNSGLTWGSQFNKFLASGFDGSLPGEFSSLEPIIYPTFNVGFMYTAYDNANSYIRDKSLSLGASIENINQSTISFSDGIEELRKHITLKGFGSAKFELHPRWHLYPSTVIVYSQGILQVNTGTYFSTLVSPARSKAAVMIQLGGWYRFNDSIIALAGFQIENIRIGGSVDLNAQTLDTTSDLANSGQFNYEVSITYNLNHSSAFKKVSSPVF